MVTDDNESLTFSRQSLRKATKFTEGDYRGINPREFYRSLKRGLEEIQKGGDFKYVTIGDQTNEDDFQIKEESVGSKTGTVEGRLLAKSEYESYGSGSINYKPYGPHGAWLIVIGIITSIFIIGIPLILIGAYLYLKDERAELPLLRRDEIRVLLTGEVSERTIEDDGEEITDIFANISVIYAGDSFVKIDTADFHDLDLAHRKQIVKVSKILFNRIVEEKNQQKEFYSGALGNFIGHLKAAANNNPESDIDEIRSVHRTLNSTFEYRTQFAEELHDFLPPGQEKELEDHYEQLMSELKELSEDMEIYVERKGLEVAG